MSLSTEFLAPPMVTVPDSGPDGRTTIRSVDPGTCMALSMLRPGRRAKSTCDREHRRAQRRHHPRRDARPPSAGFLAPRTDLLVERLDRRQATRPTPARSGRRLARDGRVDVTIERARSPATGARCGSTARPRPVTRPSRRSRSPRRSTTGWPCRSGRSCSPGRCASALRGPNRAGRPWWLPPDQLDAPAPRPLSLLCVFAVLAGYLGTLLTQTNTFFKEEFGVTDGQIGMMLAVGAGRGAAGPGRSWPRRPPGAALGAAVVGGGRLRGDRHRRPRPEPGVRSASARPSPGPSRPRWCWSSASSPSRRCRPGRGPSRCRCSPPPPPSAAASR